MKRRWVTLIPIALTIAVLVLASGNLIAGGYQINEHGARGMAQGGAFAARALDPSAIFYNAAGIGFLSGAHLQLGSTLIFPSTTFRGPLQFNSNDETKQVKNVFYPSTLYGTYSLDEQGLAFGLGVFNPYGLGSEWPADWVGRGITTKITLQTFYINPTVAYRVLPNLSIGAGFDFVYGNAVLQRKILDFSPEGEVKLDGSGTGVGFNAGVIYKPIEMLSLGISYRSQVKLKLKGTTTFTVPSQLQPLFPGGDANVELKPPATLFAGVAATPYTSGDQKLTVEFDYQWTGWSAYDTLSVKFDQHTTAQQDLVSPKNYEDSYMLRIGAEYECSDWAFRVGYIYDKTPDPDPSLDPLLPDANRSDFSIGVGYKVTPNLTIDAAYMFIAFQNRSVPLGTTIIGFDGAYSSTANLFALSLGYSF